MSKPIDLLILGATGFTGLNCIPFVDKMCKSNYPNLVWGVAGRNQNKLKDVLDQMGRQCGTDMSTIPIVVCDIRDDESLFNMARKVKIVVNCCGPYILLGEPVVKACINAGTHYVDVSGEPQFMENILLKYDEKSKEKGVYIVSACGFDSIPCDLGVIYLQQNFTGTLNSVVSYLEGWEAKGEKHIPGPSINYGTWESIVRNLHQNGLKELRTKLYKHKMPSFEPKLKRRYAPHKNNVVEGWTLPFLGADRSVVARTQRYFYESESQRPVQIDTQFVLKSFIHLILFAIFGSILIVLCKFNFGRKLLLNYPEVFSLGIFSKKQPLKEKTDNCWFQTTFYGEGWKNYISDSTPCDTVVVSRVKGRNPGYGTTCACVIGAAMMILKEDKKIPGKGGVLTPGAAFAKTSLIKFLIENGMTFEMVSEKRIHY